MNQLIEIVKSDLAHCTVSLESWVDFELGNLSEESVWNKRSHVKWMEHLVLVSWASDWSTVN